MPHPFILLAEDNPSDVKLARRAFGRTGNEHTLIVREDGKDAVDFIDQTADLPTLVLLDLKLPRLGGLHVLQHIRKNPRTRCIPVIMLTSSNEVTDLHRCYSAGANSYLRKPVDYADFEVMIGLIVRYWLETNLQPTTT